jgi:hypothetical protein
MTAFQKHFQADNSFRWYEQQHDRYVSAEYYLLQEWMADPANTPDSVPYVEPPPPVDPQTLKSPDLKSAENRYIEYCRSLDLPDVASSADFETLTTEMQNNDMMVEALAVGVRALALINDVTQNGGRWDDIVWHSEIAS